MRQFVHKYPILSYVAAVLLTLFAVGIRWLLDPLLGTTLIFTTLYGVVAFTSWLGGYKPTIIPVVLGYLLCNYLFIEPHFQLHSNAAQIIGFIAYCFTCSILIALGEITRSAESDLLKKEVERKSVEDELRKSEHKVREILESITDAFYSLDSEWRYTYINSAALKIIGSKSEDLINKVIWEMFPAAVGTKIEAFYRKVVADQVSSTLITFFEPHAKWYEIRAYPTGTGLSIYFKDVSKRMESEQQLKKQSDELAEMDRRKNEFLATLAHELRNPLAPIRNYLSIMELKGDDVTTVQKARLMIERQVSQMVRLIDDLMDVSRINHGKLELKLATVALTDVLNAAIETSRPLIESAGLTLELEQLPDNVLLYADSTRLTQVFLNIINNAAKYTNAGGKITIDCELISKNIKDNQKIILVKISDTGIGIAPEHQSKIFEGFIQLPNSLKRSHGGLGVGLMLVKRIVEMHNGAVLIESEGLGLGSSFKVELPVFSNEATESKIDNPTVQNESIASLKILVVDDNHDAALSLASYFEVLGHEVLVTYDGTSALEAAEGYQPNIIFLDIGMPDLNGLEVAKFIRKQSWGASIKLIAITGWGQEEDHRKSTAAGFDIHLVKPVDPSVLNNLLYESQV